MRFFSYKPLKKKFQVYFLDALGKEIEIDLK
jgi:hypothetical protein